MRTTLTIDDDVLMAAKERARREHRTVGEVLSDLARQALTRLAEPVGESPDFYGFKPFPSRGEAVSNDLINQLRDDEAA